MTPSSQSYSETTILELASRLGDEEDAALDGIACLHCGGHRGGMRPCGHGPRGQVFMHDPVVVCVEVREQRLLREALIALMSEARGWLEPAGHVNRAMEQARDALCDLWTTR